jgi:anti-sigma factor RsiW
MECDWVDLLLTDYLDGACHDALRARIEGHLARCARCRAGRDALAAVDAGLAGLPVPGPPEGLVDGAMRRILNPARAAANAAPGDAGSRFRDLRRLAAAAAVLAGVAGAFLAFQDEVRAAAPVAIDVEGLAAAATETEAALRETVIGFARDPLRRDRGVND